MAKRLKRTPSIVNKLTRLKGKLQLTTMNDIAGCRVILSNKKKVYKLNKLLLTKTVFELRKDYIKIPRESGYRSLHLIGKFSNENQDKHYVELQIRTLVQHYWATAVEIIDLFTNQSIKSNMGDRQWESWFKYLSELFEIFEDNPYLHSSSAKSNAVYYKDAYLKNKNNKLAFMLFKVYSLTKDLDIIKKFQLFTKSIDIANEQLKNISQKGFVLIVIDKVENNRFSINSEFFLETEFAIANEKYLEAEKNTLNDTHYVTAFVATNALGGIKEAYPNYFADSTKFLEYLGILISLYEHLYPSSLFRIANKIKYLEK